MGGFVRSIVGVRVAELLAGGRGFLLCHVGCFVGFFILLLVIGHT